MTYVVANRLRTVDVEKFLEVFNKLARPALEANGATKIRVSQTVIGGAEAGLIGIAMYFDSVSASVVALGAGNDAAGPSAREAGVELVGRSLIKIREQRGSHEGSFGSVLMAAGPGVDDPTYASNSDAFYGAMSSGVNGQMFGDVVAGGDRTGLHVAVTWTDDLDAMQSAAEAMYSNSEIQKVMSNSGISPVSRSIFKTII